MYFHELDGETRKRMLTINPYPSGFSKVDIPLRTSGQYEIQSFTISEPKAMMYNMRVLRDFNMNNQRIVPPDTYTRLVKWKKTIHGLKGNTLMSDTPAECHEHSNAYWRAEGQVLIHGLGIGLLIKALLAKDDVDQITVIEISQDVIDLVGHVYGHSKVQIIHADAFTWQPPKGLRYNYVWHDIWDIIDPENLEEMKRLHRRYGKRCDAQGSWSRDLIRAHLQDR